MLMGKLKTEQAMRGILRVHVKFEIPMSYPNGDMEKAMDMESRV